MTEPKPVRSRVARRLMMRLAVVGLAFAMLVSIGELAVEYRRDLARLTARMDQIEHGYVAAVVDNLWLEDVERLTLLTMGMERLPGIQRVEVIDEHRQVVASAGAAEHGDGPARTFPLIRDYQGRRLAIGELRISSSLAELHQRMAERAAVTLLANALVILAAAGLVYWMVHALVTRPLGRLAAYARELGRGGFSQPPPAIRHHSRHDDEFSDLAHAFEDMRLALGRSYEVMRESETRYRDLFTNSPVSLWEEDFSAVKQALESLRPGVADLPAYLAENPHAVQAMAALVRILDVNEASLLLHRARSREQLMGQLADTFTPSSYDAFRRQLLAIWHDECELALEAEVRSLDGDVREVVVRWYVPPLYRESLSRVIVSLEDVTDRKAAERSLTITVEKLMQANSELERLTFIAAHHLQEPVRAAISFSQLLERRLGGHIDAEVTEYLGFLVKAARRMQDQVRGLLDYAQSGQVSGNFAAVDMAAAVGAACETLSDVIADSGASLDLQPLPTVNGDFALLSLVFRHLIGNAVKFRRPDVAPRIGISATRRGEVWEFAVADNGIGFDEAFSASIFQVFGRLHGPAEYPGAGIGLAVCKRIVELHGGRIRASATLGEGATFHFTLPANDG